MDIFKVLNKSTSTFSPPKMFILGVVVLEVGGAEGILIGAEKLFERIPFSKADFKILVNSNCLSFHK